VSVVKDMFRLSTIGSRQEVALLLCMHTLHCTAYVHRLWRGPQCPLEGGFCVDADNDMTYNHFDKKKLSDTRQL